MENLQTVAQSLAITLINFFAAEIFVSVSDTEKKSNIGETNITSLKSIFVFVYINTGLNPVLQDRTFW